MTETANPNVLINFVLDKSGSMLSITKATIDGVNQLLDEQRNQPGDARLSLTMFNTGFDVRYVAELLENVPPLDHDSYQPGGGTSLFDAVGTTIKGTEKWLENHKDWEGQVLTVILTDGQELNSREWHINIPADDEDEKDVAQLIKYKQAQGWQFLFLGSGGSAWLEKSFGHVLRSSSFVGYAHTSTDNSAAYAGVSRKMSKSRAFGSAFDNSDLISDTADGSLK